MKQNKKDHELTQPTLLHTWHLSIIRIITDIVICEKSEMDRTIIKLTH